MACVTAVVGNNGIAYIQTRTKLHRAIDKSKGRVLRDVITRTEESNLVMPDGTQLPILIGQPDVPRLCRALEHVARGLYFHLKKIRFTGECHILPDFIRFPEDPEVEVIKRISHSLLLRDGNDWACYGENPDIFSFQLGPADEYGLFAMVMTFFRGAKVFVAFQPTGVKLPFHTKAISGNPLKIEIQLGD